MTQAGKLKWVLALAVANAALALMAGALVARGVAEAGRAVRGVEQAREVRAGLEEVRDLRRAVDGLRVAVQSRPAAAADPQVSQTLQLLASAQQLVLLRPLQVEQAPAAAPAQRSTARKPTARRPRRIRSSGCDVP